MNRVCLLSILLLAFSPAAMAQGKPAEVGAHGYWTVLTVNVGNAKVCYVQSTPRTISPRNVNRDPIFFVVSDWPSRKVKGEPEVVPGYPYKADSKVTAQIGSTKFEFFTENDGGTGGAWLQNRSDEQKLVDAMRRGNQMTVTGTSTRGTVTRDVYSLSGFTAAIEEAHKTCNM